MVNFLSSHLKDEAAGQAPRNAAAVDGLKELGGAEGHGDRTPQVAHLDLDACGAEHPLRQVHRTADGGSGALGDVHRVADMVAVPVGDKDEIRLHLIGSSGCQGIARQEGIRQHLAGAVMQQKTGMA